MRGFPQIDSTAVGCGAVALYDMNSRRMSFPQIDSAAVDSGAVELDDMNLRRTSFPPDERVTIYGWPRWLACQCALDW